MKFAIMAASATSFYSTTNAAMFNWNGNPATPGYGVSNPRSTPRPGP